MISTPYGEFQLLPRSLLITPFGQVLDLQAIRVELAALAPPSTGASVTTVAPATTIAPATAVPGATLVVPDSTTPDLPTNATTIGD